MRKKETKAGGAGIVPKTSKMSSYEAKQEALHLMRTNRVNYGTILSNVIDLLATAGVWTEDQLMELTTASRRTLQRYRQKAYLDLTSGHHQVTSLFAERNLKVYCLGPIGLAIAEIKYGLIPTGYLQQKTDRVTHDLLCNQVFYHLYQECAPLQYVAILKGKYEATLHDEKGRPILEPDAMIILRHEITGKEKVFLVEYHNENFSSRAAEKVRKYEYIYRKADWQDRWNVESFPTLLIATTHRAPALGYREDIEQRKKGMGIKCKYMIKSIAKLLDGSESRLHWLDLEQNRFIDILKV